MNTDPPRDNPISMSHFTRLLLLGLTCLGLSSCIAFHDSAGVRVGSDPPGARILVEGRDSGFVTPAFINLDKGRSRIDFQLDGYQDATRVVRSESSFGSLHWAEMDLNASTWRFPLWLDYDDFLGMWSRNSSFSPLNLFVRMRLSGDV